MLPNTRNYPAKDKHHSELHLIWRKHERDLWAIVGWGGLSFFFLSSRLYVVVQLYCGTFSPLGVLFFIRATEWRVTVMTSKLIKRHKITLAPPLRLEKTREQKENIQPSGSFFFSLSLARFHHQIPPFLLFLGFSHFVFCVCALSSVGGERDDGAEGEIGGSGHQPKVEPRCHSKKTDSMRRREPIPFMTSPTNQRGSRWTQQRSKTTKQKKNTQKSMGL